jgi:hypothetical protein
MKKSIPAFLVMCFLTLGCTQESTSPSLIQSVTQLKKGNYWIYETYKVFPSGMEEKLGRDSVFISGDSTINDKTYSILNYGRVYTKQRFKTLLRDSLGYLVSNAGTIHLMITSDPVKLKNQYSVVNKDTVAVTEYKSVRLNVNVPVGQFETFAMEGTFKALKPLPNVISPRVFYTAYAKNIGRVYESYLFSQSDYIFEERLVRYRVQ